MRAYNGCTPHSLLGGRFGVFTHHITFTGHCVGPLVFPFASSAGVTKVHLPLDSSLDSCLAWTSNVVHASLAMPPLKNLHLRHNQMAAARSQVGPNHGSLIRHAAGEAGPSQAMSTSPLWSLFRGDLELD